MRGHRIIHQGSSTMMENKKFDQLTAVDPGENSPTETNKTILLLEDDPDVRVLVVSMLDQLGYNVLEACDGATAIEIMESAPHVDMLLTDIILPGGITGVDFAEMARRRFPHIKLLFMSGNPYKARSELAKFQPAPQLLAKPFQFQDLVLKVQHALNNPQFPGDHHAFLPG